MYFIRLIFWISFIAVLYTYVLYPLLLLFLSLIRKKRKIDAAQNAQPFVSVLIAAYNEDRVIRQKIESILNTSYPPEKIEILVGSDNSTDLTNSIINELAAADNRIRLIPFDRRSGKVTIINKLVTLSQHPVLILTDANVNFERETLPELLKHFNNDNVCLVDSNMVNTGLKKTGISRQEKTYIRAEVYIKYYEGLLWGTMMGPFGGCYAIRKSYYRPVPVNFLVDDFYINMQVLLNGGKCINELNARVYEDVSSDPYLEFRRKIRIAAGSFQNLYAFFGTLFHLNAISFCFFSHKVLRWLSPFLIITFYMCTIRLYAVPFFNWFKWVTTFVLLTPFIDYVFRTLKINFVLFRFPAHFITSNAALLLGFFRFISGIRSGIWQPTKRLQ